MRQELQHSRPMCGRRYAIVIQGVIGGSPSLYRVWQNRHVSAGCGMEVRHLYAGCGRRCTIISRGGPERAPYLLRVWQEFRHS